LGGRRTGTLRQVDLLAPRPPAAQPLVLLDVDGVLNAIGGTSAWPDWRRGSATAEGRDFPITWSPSVVDAVRSWQERADVQWLTTWGHDANASLRHLLSLPELPVAGTYDDAGDDRGAPERGDPDATAGAHAAVTPAAPDALTGRWWKFDVVRRLVRADPARRLVWIDDDLAGQDQIRAWMRREAACLLVAPPPRSGLTPAHLRAVAEFLGE
jgi:hypothetical protein